jgi:hypothetical protein
LSSKSFRTLLLLVFRRAARAAQVACGIDEAHVRERLRKIAQHAVRTRIVFLGEQANVVSKAQQVFEQFARFIVAALEREIISEPETAHSALRRLGCKRASRDLLDLVLPHFQRYDWPGNVREMENIVERMTLFYSDLEDGDTPDMEQLARVVPEIFNATSPSALALANDVGALRSAARNAELARILKTIEECNGNQAEACRRLGIGRTTLWRRLRLLDPAAIKRA